MPPQRTPRSRQSSSLIARHVSMMGLSTMRQSPRWSIMGRPRQASVDRRPIGPDPCAYHPSDPGLTSKMPRSPRAAFGSKNRKVLEHDKESDIPGPGQYSHNSSIDLGMLPRKTSASLSTPRNRERAPRANTPDPGCYYPVDPQSTSKMGRSPSYGFATSRASRFPQLKDRSPGPGSYPCREELGSGGTNFERGPPRRREMTRRESPDPGAYAVVDPSTTSQMPRSPRTSFDTRSSTGRASWGQTGNEDREEKPGDVPGPGAYAHKEMLGEIGGTSFSRSLQRKELKPRTDSPDPGTYVPVDPSSTSKMPKQAGYGFGTVNTGRIPVAENGMKGGADENGLANDADTNGHRPSQGGSSRVPVAGQDDIPGPGSYEVIYAAPNTAKSSPRYGFGTLEARPSHARSVAAHGPSPGPGTYALTVPNRGTGPMFSMRGRMQTQPTESPGPGAYGGHWTQFV
jgi:hypothetical protein